MVVLAIADDGAVGCALTTTTVAVETQLLSTVLLTYTLCEPAAIPANDKPD